MEYGPFTLSLTNRSKLFERGNIIQFYSKEFTLCGPEKFKCVEKSTWDKIFPKKRLVFDLYGTYNKEATRGIRQVFPVTNSIKTADAEFFVARAGWNIECQRFGIWLLEKPWHEHAYQSDHYLITVNSIPDVSTILWEEVEQEQGEIYA